MAIETVKIYFPMNGWNYEMGTTKDDYDGILDELGGKYKGEGTEADIKKDFLKGVNNLKPKKVKIAYGTSNDGVVGGGETKQVVIGYATRRIAPAKEKEVEKLIGKDIKITRRGAGVKTYKILDVVLGGMR
jgi:hypothetical protein